MSVDELGGEGGVCRQARAAAWVSGCSIVSRWILEGGVDGWGHILGLLSLTVDGVEGGEMKTVREWWSGLGLMDEGDDRNGGIFNGSQGSKRRSIVGELLGGA